MKNNILLFVLVMALPFVSYEQAHIDTIPAYLKNTAIPSFQILTDTVLKKGVLKDVAGNDSAGMVKDSTWFTNADLPKNRPVVIVYFSPECSHCQHEAEELEKSMDSAGYGLHKAFYVWVSFHPLKDLKKFGSQYHLDKFKNICIGRDLKYYIPSYFKVEFTPYIGVYNKNGRFVKEFRQGATPAELAAALAL